MRTTVPTTEHPAPLPFVQAKYEAFQRFRSFMSTRSAFRKKNRSAYANFLRAKYEAYTGAVDVKSYPYYLCVDPCDVCQLRCPTCPTGIENERKRGPADQRVTYRGRRSMLSPDLFNSLMDELGEYLFLVMFYNYGEPLLNRHLPEFIRNAAARDIATEIHTNLSLPISDEQISELMSSGLDHLNASIDGFSQETYQKHRVGGDLALVKRNLERIAAARDRLRVPTEITYKFLVFSHNEHEIAAARRYCDSLGIKFLYGDAFIDDPAWLPSYRKDEQPYFSETDIKARVAEWDAAGQPDYWNEHEKRGSWFYPAVQKKAKEPAFCTWHYGFSVITAGGPVAPCCAAAKDRDDFGTVVPGEVSFAEVWNSAKVQKSRASFAGKDTSGADGVDSVCLRCYFPKFVQQIYSLHDIKVTAQFYRQIGRSEPELRHAFDLLARTRYGRIAHGIVRLGAFHPLLMAMGNGNETDASEFVRYFAAHLEGERPSRRPAAAPPLPLRVQFGALIVDGRMRRGWYPDEAVGSETLRWSRGAESTVEIDLPPGRDIRMELDCEPFNFPGCDEQRVSVLLNGALIEELALAPSRRTYSVVLPRERTRAWLNTLELRYAHVYRPRSVMQNTSDTRKLAMACYSIEFAELAS
jgi:MoaA/NifB/PqqE/SkfB family radical SAM enzyme